MLTGEYVVLDGATAFAIPTNKGQYLAIKQIPEPNLVWKSYDEKNQLWYEDSFSLTNLQKHATTNAISKKLIAILLAAKQLNPSFLSEDKGFYVTTRLTFNRSFGLGSSSTLIANIAKWAKVDSYQLLWNSFKGSGYDLACATNSSALLYQIKNRLPVINTITFNPKFKGQIYFVYLNTKQDSKEGIALYKTLSDSAKELAITAINKISKEITNCTNISAFNSLLKAHENSISTLLQTPTVQEKFFGGYKHGVVKSLGAWGGDFVMVTVAVAADLDYFRKKGYDTIYSFKEMLL